MGSQSQSTHQLNHIQVKPGSSYQDLDMLLLHENIKIYGHWIFAWVSRN